MRGLILQFLIQYFLQFITTQLTRLRSVAVQSWVLARRRLHHLLPDFFLGENRGFEVVTEDATEAPAKDDISRSAFQTLSQRGSVPSVSEEESVPVSKLLELLPDDAGKKRPHLFTLE